MQMTEGNKHLKKALSTDRDTLTEEQAGKWNVLNVLWLQLQV